MSEKFIVAIDCETHLITDDVPIPELVCVSVNPCINGKFLFTGKEFKKHLITMLKSDKPDNDIVLVAQNAAFDFSVFAVSYGEEIFELINKAYKDGRILCTKLFEKLIRLKTDGDTNGKGEFALDFLAEKYLGEDITASKKDGDSWRLRYSELDGIPICDYPTEAAEYAKEDARICFDVYREQVLQYGNSTNLSLQCHSDWVLRVMAAGGLCIDGDFLEERLKEVTAVVDKQNIILKDEGILVRKFKKKNPDEFKKDTKVVKAIVTKFFNEQGLVPPQTPKGNIKMDVDTLDAMEGYDKGVDALIAIGTNGKALSTYLKPWHGKERIYTQYDVLKDTGRMSSFKPNIQNVPRFGRIRGCIVPSEGNVFCAIDFSQLELCALAQVIKEQLPDIEHCLLNAINEGKDLHCLTASTIIGMEYDEFMEQKVELKDFRQMAKAANFGLPGGLGAATFQAFARKSYGVTLDDDDVKDIISAYFETFPDVKAYLKSIPKLKVTTDLDTFYKCEQLFTDRVRMISEKGYCSAANTFFQGLASDGVKSALIDVAEYCWFGLKGTVNPVMIIHDEIIFEIPNDKYMGKQALELSDIMVEAMQKWMPDVTNIQAEPALMERWEKEAEPTYNDKGELILWKMA